MTTSMKQSLLSTPENDSNCTVVSKTVTKEIQGSERDQSDYRRSTPDAFVLNECSFRAALLRNFRSLELLKQPTLPFSSSQQSQPPSTPQLSQISGPSSPSTRVGVSGRCFSSSAVTGDGASEMKARNGSSTSSLLVSDMARPCWWHGRYDLYRIEAGATIAYP